jgi:hypothetical protein
MDTVEQDLLKVPQPQWWDEIPDVPFKRICSYLDSHEVFNILPLVCKHFSQVLKNNQTVPVGQIILPISPSKKLLEEYGRRVSTCKKIRMWPEVLQQETRQVMLELFEKWKNCITALCAESVSTAVTSAWLIPVLNTFSRLDTLEIESAGHEWNWQLHNITPSLVSLKFRSYITQNKVVLLEKFPNLKNLDCHGFRSNIDWDVVNVATAARIERLINVDNEMPLVPPTHFTLIENIKEIRNLRIRNLDCWQNVVDVFPLLPELETFDCVGSSVYEDILATENFIFDLLAFTPDSLVSLKIDFVNHEMLKNCDLDIVKRMTGLPATLTNVQYKGFKVRNCPNCLGY